MSIFGQLADRVHRGHLHSGETEGGGGHLGESHGSDEAQKRLGHIGEEGP